MSVTERVANELRRRGLAGARVLVAVSGGIDSVALLRAACAARDGLGLQMVVGHYNHRFRGDAADADAVWVASLAQRLGLDCEIGVADRVAESSVASVPEESARHERYAFLTQLALDRQCVAVLTAHTADDQVETVLHHVFRGTGLTGLHGIPTDRPLTEGVRLIRPLLDVPRSMLEQYLVDIGQDHRTDATNA
ncbi:MAG TPA: tRNA lysidine(34) synthetase TilS, partial [Planctomycetaceae bacterium]|nr:tRNA lysidine(34) synthetase TilS [Planctomycetaceae bacterium]